MNISESRRRQHTVLIVDGGPELLAVLTRWLERRDYHVVSYKNTDYANYCLSTRLVDVIILDLVPPCENGLRFLERLKKNGNRIPVILISDDSTVDWQTATAMGAVGFLQKPVQFSALAFLLSEHVALSGS